MQRQVRELKIRSQQLSSTKHLQKCALPQTSLNREAWESSVVPFTEWKCVRMPEGSSILCPCGLTCAQVRESWGTILGGESCPRAVTGLCLPCALEPWRLRSSGLISCWASWDAERQASKGLGRIEVQEDFLLVPLFCPQLECFCKHRKSWMLP